MLDVLKIKRYHRTLLNPANTELRKYGNLEPMYFFRNKHPGIIKTANHISSLGKLHCMPPCDQN